MVRSNQETVPADTPCRADESRAHLNNRRLSLSLFLNPLHETHDRAGRVANLNESFYRTWHLLLMW
jgi:hypothetical protein